MPLLRTQVAVIECDNCQVQTGGFESARETEREAMAIGWQQLSSMIEWLCPDCVKNPKARKDLRGQGPVTIVNRSPKNGLKSVLSD
jgi:hypothetical protein